MMFNRSRSTQILGIAALAVVLAVQHAAVYAQPATTPWPMFGQNAQRTGKSLFNGPLTGDLMWVAGTLGGVDEIAIGQKAIYAVDSGGLYAFNFDGSLRWKGGVGNYTCGPAVDANEVVYLGSRTSQQFVYRFVAIDENAPGAYVDSQKNLVNGIKWSYATGEIQSRAAIDADGSIFVTQLTPPVIGSSPPGVLYKFTSQGSVLWQFSIAKMGSGGPALGPDGTVYVSQGDSCLYALTSAGKLKWKFKLNGSGMDPVVGDPSKGGAVYVNTTNWMLSAVDPSNGRKIWSVSLGKAATWDYSQCVPAVDNANKTVYCLGQNAFYAFRFDGTLKWSVPAVDDASKPAIGSDGTVYVCWGGMVRALSPVKGTILWSRDAPGVRCHPVIDIDNTLYVGGTGLDAYQDGAVARPTVFWLRFSPNVPAAGQALTLGADQVTAGALPILQVDFYRDTDGDGQLDPDKDEYLGPSTEPVPPDNWLWKLNLPAGLPAGPHTVFAQATDSGGVESNVASVQFTVTP